MSASSLTLNEKKVLYGLVRCPSYSDREMAEALGMKLPTVTAIRHRLEKDGYIFSVAWTPEPELLGLRFLNVAYSSYSTGAATPHKLRIVDKLAQRYDEVVWCMGEPGQQIFIQLGEDFTDIKRNLDDIEKKLRRNGFLEESGLAHVTVPLELCDHLLFFDFAPMLAREFGLEGDSIQAARETKKIESSVGDLSDTEKAVLYGLVSNPTYNNTELADEVGMSRYTVGRVRKRLEENGILRKSNIPDLLKLGFQIMAFTHARFNLRLARKKRAEGFEALMLIHPPFFVVKDAVDVMALEAYKDFEDFRRHVGQFSSVYEKEDIYVKEPVRLLFSIPVGRTVREYDYGPVVKKALGL